MLRVQEKRQFACSVLSNCMSTNLPYRRTCLRTTGAFFVRAEMGNELFLSTKEELAYDADVHR